MPLNPTTEVVEAPALRPVWDLPTRLFHWLLTALIAFSWWSAETGQIEWHIWSGFAILTLLIFRLLWGLVGSSTARVATFVRGPGALRDYVRDHQTWRLAGHNPLGALSVIVLLLATAVQVALGLVAVDEDGLNEGPLARLVSLETSERARNLHADMFDVLLFLIVLHVAAIIFYRLLLGRKLTGPMISGRAELEPGIEPMRPGRGWVAVVCLLLALAVTRWIVAGAPPFAT